MFWGTYNDLPRRDKKWIQKKLAIRLRPYLCALRPYSQDAAEALTDSPRYWMDLLDDFNPDLVKPKLCLCWDCRTWGCYAWIAFKCGGCGQSYWYHQTQLVELWCGSCSHKWSPDNNRVQALREFTGIVDPTEALQRFESLEQRIVGYYAWTAQTIVKKVEAIAGSTILVARCQKGIPLTQTSIVGPLQTDPEQELSECIRQLRECGISTRDQARLKKEKGKKKKRN